MVLIVRLNHGGITRAIAHTTTHTVADVVVVVIVVEGLALVAHTGAAEAGVACAGGKNVGKDGFL